MPPQNIYINKATIINIHAHPGESLNERFIVRQSESSSERPSYRIGSSEARSRRGSVVGSESGSRSSPRLLEWTGDQASRAGSHRGSVVGSRSVYDDDARSHYSSSSRHDDTRSHYSSSSRRGDDTRSHYSGTQASTIRPQGSQYGGSSASRLTTRTRTRTRTLLGTISKAPSRMDEDVRPNDSISMVSRGSRVGSLTSRSMAARSSGRSVIEEYQESLRGSSYHGGSTAGSRRG
ncbi:hypothetical protein BJX70DRAFT_404049 [Aspergillus crustosus]